MAPSPGLDVRWHAGVPAGQVDTAQPIQVHRYDERTVILRQSKSVHFEAPFLFLLLGERRALLLDTGAVPDPERSLLRRTVDALVEQWLASHPHEGYELVVAHTHGHGDHVAGDGQFADRDRTVLVGPHLADVVAFYGFDDWPSTSRQLDLGGRVVDVLPAPGHEEAAIVVFDRATGLLLTGDTLYRGRLYVEDWDAFAESADRLVAFCADREVVHVLGCHIEMSTTPGVDYPRGATHQPEEPPLQMGVEHVRALQRAVAAVEDRQRVHVLDEFILHPHPPTDAV